ncbi:hypothetical protein QBC39DRAFT_16065 [Podospora conica]|nr:hypothetical protein QBC39DRAFT_16065 [Schizothecium conicum]
MLGLAPLTSTRLLLASTLFVPCPSSLAARTSRPHGSHWPTCRPAEVNRVAVKAESAACSGFRPSLVQNCWLSIHLARYQKGYMADSVTWQGASFSRSCTGLCDVGVDDLFPGRRRRAGGRWSLVGGPLKYRGALKIRGVGPIFQGLGGR